MSENLDPTNIPGQGGVKTLPSDEEIANEIARMEGQSRASDVMAQNLGSTQPQAHDTLPMTDEERLAEIADHEEHFAMPDAVPHRPNRPYQRLSLRLKTSLKSNHKQKSQLGLQSAT